MSTIGSVTKSSNDLGKVEQVLKEFLNGQSSLSQIVEALRGLMIVRFESQYHREIHENRLDGVIRIPIEEHHVRNMLQKYIAGKLTKEDLSDRAAFIFLSQVFVPKGETEEKQWQAGEDPVWDVLQRLMSPDIFDGLSSVTAKNYLRMLQ